VNACRSRSTARALFFPSACRSRPQTTRWPWLPASGGCSDNRCQRL
jgi:hypothetical protein